MWQALIAPITAIIDKIILDPKAAAEAKIKLLELEQSGELQRIAAEQQSQQVVNQTMQAEYATQDKFKSGWRPLFGYVMAISFGAMMGALIFALVYVILYDPKSIHDILKAVIEMFFAGLTVLGISIHQRSKDKKTLSGEAQTSAFEKLANFIRRK